MKALLYNTVVRPTLLHGCETWPVSARDETRKRNDNDRYEDGATDDGREPSGTS